MEENNFRKPYYLENNYHKAYKEIVELLKFMSKEDVEKLPDEVILTFKIKMDKDHPFEIDKSKSLKEQNFLEETKDILSNLYRDYWASPEEKKRIIAKEKVKMQKAEEEKRKKYNPDNIFNNAPKRDPFEENGISYKKKNNFMTGGDINEKNAGVVLEAINKTSEEIEKNKQDSNNEMGIKKSENGFLGKLVVFFKNIFGNK